MPRRAVAHLAWGDSSPALRHCGFPTSGTATIVSSSAVVQRSRTQRLDPWSEAMPAKTLNRDELLQLPAVVSVPVAARALGLGRNKAYELVKAGQFPCAVLRLGHTYRVPTAELLRILGVHPPRRRRPPRER